MALMKGFSRVDEEGRIAIPKNIRREAGFKHKKLVEIKVHGAGSSRHITIKASPGAR